LKHSKVIRWLLLLGLAGLIGVYAWGSERDRLYKQARKAEKAGHYTDAYLLYSQARALEPSRQKYILAAEAVRKRAAQEMAAAGRMEASASLAVSSAQGTPDSAQSSQPPDPDVVKPIGTAEMQEVTRLRPPVDLEPDQKLADFHIKGTIQETYEKVAREFGLDVLFDSDYQGSQKTRFEMRGCDFQQAILALNDVADSFVVPISPKLFLVAADNAQKRTELEPVIAVLQPIPDAVTPEEVTEISQAVQQSLEMKRLQIDTTRRQIFLRDTVTRVRLAQAMLANLSKPRAEVVLDIDLLAVSDSDRLRLGLELPSAFPIENLSTIWNNQPTVAEGVTNLLGIGGGKTVFGLAIGASSLVATRISSESRLLSRFRIRATSGMKANLHIGEKYPIINARFSPATIDDTTQGSIDNGTFVEPFPSFTFEDLGLVLDVVPQVHSAREVSMQLEVQFRLLTGSTANEIPIISNRQFKAYTRLVEGEVALISGIAVSQTFKVRTGVIGLSDIPWLGNLFKRHTRETMVSDLLVLVQPHVVRLPPAELQPTLTLRYGPEQRPLPGI
jgi:general secretion pathway protein D